MLHKMNLQQLKTLANRKGISFSLNDRQKEYYAEWSEKDLMVDMMNDVRDLSVKEIEEHLKVNRK